MNQPTVDQLLELNRLITEYVTGNKFQGDPSQAIPAGAAVYHAGSFGDLREEIRRIHDDITQLDTRFAQSNERIKELREDMQMVKNYAHTHMPGTPCNLVPAFSDQPSPFTSERNPDPAPTRRELMSALQDAVELIRVITSGNIYSAPLWEEAARKLTDTYDGFCQSHVQAKEPVDDRLITDEWLRSCGFEVGTIIGGGYSYRKGLFGFAIPDRGSPYLITSGAKYLATEMQIRMLCAMAGEELKEPA